MDWQHRGPGHIEDHITQDVRSDALVHDVQHVEDNAKHGDQPEQWVARGVRCQPSLMRFPESVPPARCARNVVDATTAPFDAISFATKTRLMPIEMVQVQIIG